MNAVVSISGLTKIYQKDSEAVQVLQGIDLSVAEGDYLALMGPSGSGKTTLLNLIAGIDKPDAGELLVGGEDITRLGEADLADWRASNVGFVFQFYNLMPVLTAFENVELPLLFGGVSPRKRRERVEELMARVGLSDRMEFKPTELSGGQMQRVAIARALAMNPDVVLADEPTGNLDTSAGGDIMELFTDLWKQGSTLVVITHDMTLARRAGRAVEIRDGLIVRDGAVAA